MGGVHITEGWDRISDMEDICWEIWKELKICARNNANEKNKSITSSRRNWKPHKQSDKIIVQNDSPVVSIYLVKDGENISAIKVEIKPPVVIELTREPWSWHFFSWLQFSQLWKRLSILPESVPAAQSLSFKGNHFRIVSTPLKTDYQCTVIVFNVKKRKLCSFESGGKI